MSTLSFDTSFVTKFATREEINNYDSIVRSIHNNMHSINPTDKNALGWLNYVDQMSDKEISIIEKVAEEVQNNADLLIVIGVGGSYLGAKAIQVAPGDYFPKKLNRGYLCQ